VKVLGRERQIRYLMRRFGLTREEAEGLLKFDDSGNSQIRRVPIKGESEADPTEQEFWKTLLVMAGFAGLALADWLLRLLSKRKKKRRGEIQEWIV